jgi:hypothetical protein
MNGLMRLDSGISFRDLTQASSADAGPWRRQVLCHSSCTVEGCMKAHPGRRHTGKGNKGKGKGKNSKVRADPLQKILRQAATLQLLWLASALSDAGWCNVVVNSGPSCAAAPSLRVLTPACINCSAERWPSWRLRGPHRGFWSLPEDGRIAKAGVA